MLSDYEEKSGLFGFLKPALSWVRYKFDKHYTKLTDLIYLIKNKRTKYESWNLFDHILDDIAVSGKKLAENLHGYPVEYIDIAKSKIAGSPEDYDNYNGIVSSLASTLWKQDIEYIVDLVMLYRYYNDCGIVDPRDKNMLETERKYKNTLPYKEGTDQEIDYKKLSELQMECWKKICAWMEKKAFHLSD